MSLNPFASVDNYAASMLNKIGVFSFFALLGAIALLRSYLPSLDAILASLSPEIEVAGIKVGAGTVIPAILLALMSRMFKLHDRLSDLLGIRRRFDQEAILLPMALASGATLSIEQVRRLRERRREFMGLVFYKYVSSTKDKAEIDRHAITIALDQWAWYWILLEACFFALVTSIVLIIVGHLAPAVWLLLAILTAQGLLLMSRGLSVGFALDEVALVLSERDRREDIARAFRAI
jgi:hypothetical protein